MSPPSPDPPPRVTPTLRIPAHEGRAAQTRIVLLPPAYGAPEDFVAAGFASAVRERGLDVDLAFPAVPLEQVPDGSAAAALSAELMRPAHKAASTLWLGGISLGGYVALCCAARDPGALAGLCLFAPYVGSHCVTGEIERAAGLEAWRPGDLVPGDDERRVWRFIATLREGALAVHLGLGRDDRFASRHRLLAAALDPRDVDVVPGAHDWRTWRALWDRFLDARLAPTRGPDAVR